MAHQSTIALRDQGIDVHAATARPLWRRALSWLLALDTLARERCDLASLDAHTLRDIGIGPEDVAALLRRPGRHLSSIRARDELEH
jgi:uncharacterized protein YjiS (DUF1127 family)